MSLAPMETASFCDEERRAKDIVDSGNQLLKKQTKKLKHLLNSQHSG